MEIIDAADADREDLSKYVGEGYDDVEFAQEKLIEDQVQVVHKAVANARRRATKVARDKDS